MKKKILTRAAALLLSVLLAGCGSASVPQTEQRETDNTVTRLVNEAPIESVNRSEYAPESPDLDTLLAGSELQTEAAQASLQFTGSDSSDEIRAVWISYLELDGLLKNKTKAQFEQNIGEVFDNVKGFSLNTVIVQVRPFGDALYESQYFPWSYLITGTEGKDPGYDPLEVMVRQARNRGLRIEAWVNPYRVRAAGNNNALSASNPARQWLDAGDGAAISYNGITSYNPASEKARTLIINGIREIVRNYDIDAIHIDDYFYPTTDAAFDAGSYSAYKNSGGTLSLGDWRRGNVETLIRGIYSAVKDENPNVLFGISPQGNVNINYNDQYLDVAKIAASSGYCDYLCPQVYYGFQNENQPFAQVVNTWNEMIGDNNIKLYIGIGAYKFGLQDNWAGAGKNEWLNTSTHLRDMVTTSRTHNNYSGFVLYRYDSIFRPSSAVSAQVSKETGNLRTIL